MYGGTVIPLAHMGNSRGLLTTRIREDFCNIVLLRASLEFGACGRNGLPVLATPLVGTCRTSARRGVQGRRKERSRLESCYRPRREDDTVCSQQRYWCVRRPYQKSHCTSIQVPDILQDPRRCAARPYLSIYRVRNLLL